MLAVAAASVATLSWGKALIAAAVLAAVALLAGVIVIVGRTRLMGKAATPGGGPAPGGAGSPGSPDQPDTDFIRSWIAITLVISLIAFSAFAFAVNDSTLRSTLIGGLIASVGSAIAFYFSSKAANSAQQAIASAAAGTDLVPSLIGKTQADASQALGKTTFRLVEEPPEPTAGLVVVKQIPAQNTYAARGSSVTASFGPAPPAGDAQVQD